MAGRARVFTPGVSAERPWRLSQRPSVSP
jgi:hypothetical protein